MEIKEMADDTISRSAAIEAMGKATWAINRLKELPPAQLQRTGHWIPHLQDARGYADEFECSACKRFVHFSYPTRICDYEYCPYCNAKMED